QALANASSSFAYDTATQKVADAQARLAEVQKDSKSTSADLNDATNSLNHALLAQVEAAGRLAADSLPATATETQKATAANGAMLQQLYQLRDTMGSAFPAALQNAITGLQRSGATANNYSAQAYGALSATQNLVGGLFNLGQQHPQPSVTVQPGNSVGILSTIKAGIDRLYSKTIYINTINTVRNILGMGGSAAGGAVDDIPAIKAATGRVVGPGGPTEDRVPAVGPGGTPWRLSPGEWVVKAAAVRALEAQYGATAMPTINSGRLPVATDTGSSGSLMKVSGGAASTVSVGELHLHFEGTWDLTNPQQLRAVGSKIRDVIIKLDREVR
ncbi:MAG: hypothetical protein HOU81_09890, partial [Hamadaea sp.]|nr:hypothetical protein [Nocardioidaceae bacterium]NUR71121.1 hypothetical protein [Hamadaea sp.]